MASEKRPIELAASEELVRNVINTVRAQEGLDTSYYKVFAIGFNKTGTTSLSTVFQKLGFTPMDGPHWRKTSEWWIHYQFQAFSDGPPEDFRHLDRSFPRSKFILNVRNLDEWIDSRIEHVRVRMKEPKYRAQMSGGKLPGRKSIRNWVKRRQEHHADVLDYFAERPDDLLVLNYITESNAPERVARFLGKPTAGLSKPYVRSTAVTREHNTLKNEALIRETLEEIGIPREHHGADVLIPGWSAA
ncbi:sulfotransferase [Pseudoponticoccus marisrubri]|uniref:Sulfotransferase domain-containing protein n=1 Tax=Pseudoponticoccus marisrubri TaxID=1685382 RepID=A0A0W7WET5_9RHOB|nr:sulfotransferase [Pseudoponticoccus marisrubri]KUF08984.1 hypothetical protein AVJ23_20050 [Pseudoponticoccus marisrubri]